MTHDPFPRDRLGATVRRMPAYGRLAVALAMDPRLAKKRRAAVVAAAGYLISPIDLVPGIIPVLGQLDDLAVGIAALRFALAGLDAERRRAHLAGVGLADTDLAEDLATLGAVTAWSVRAGVRATRRAAVRGAELAVMGGELAASGARAAAGVATAGASRVSPRLREAAAPIAKRASDAMPEAAKTAGAKVTPTARRVADRLSPVARGAATRIESAARDSASRGAGLARRARGRAPKVNVSVPQRPALPAPLDATAVDGEPESPAG